MNGEITNAVSCLRYLDSCFSIYGGPEDDVKICAREQLNTFCAKKVMFYVTIVCLGVMRELYKRAVVPS